MSTGTMILRHELAPTTRTEQTVEPARLVADTAELRDDLDETSARAIQLHHSAEELHLAQTTRQLEAASAVDLLDALADELLFPWALLARVVGVSPTAVRKWRRGETVTPGHHHRLAEFLAFCRTLQHRDPRIEDVSRWFEMPVDSRSDITRLDLFLAGTRPGLLDLAAARRSGEDLLDAEAEGWRERAATTRRFRVLVHEDGTTSLVPSSHEAAASAD
jgi:hypothetical protein